MERRKMIKKDANQKILFYFTLLKKSLFTINLV
jgi:hypothetical protein